jgi:type VI secretion system secreted protein Hcp
MAVDMFLEIEKLSGESQDKVHKDQIQILGWSWAVAQTGTSSTGGGASAGKSEHNDLEVRKVIDRASPVLYQWCASGVHIGFVNLTVRKAGGDSLEYLVIRLEDVIITSFDVGGEPKDDQIQEKIRLNYARASMTYTPQEASGMGGAKISGGWNLKEGAPFLPA